MKLPGRSDRSRLERKIALNHACLVSAREELEVVIHQLASLNEDEDEARVHMLVSETTAAQRDWRQAAGHAGVLDKRRLLLIEEIAQLQRTENELLSKLVV